MDRVATELFAAHAEGIVPTLPEPVLAARDRAEAAGAALRHLRERMPSPLDVEAAAAADAAADPGRFTDPADVATEAVEAARALDRLRTAERIWSEAVERADAALRAVLDAEHDAIVAEHLRPVQDRILDGVRKVAGALAGLDLSDAHLAYQSSEKVRTAYRVADEAAIRYGQLRRVYSRLMAAGHPADYYERLSRHAEIKNIDVVAPAPKVWFGPGSGPTVPWPDHPVGRLVHLVTSEAAPWMPTATELAEHVAGLEQARSAASPLQHVPRPTLGPVRSGRRPTLSTSQRWTEDATDL